MDLTQTALLPKMYIFCEKVLKEKKEFDQKKDYKSVA